MRNTPFLNIIVLVAFLANTFGFMPVVYADEFRLPVPGVMVHLSPEFNPPILKGIKVHPENPFRFDFILDKGDDRHPEQEATKLIKYFLASLTIPEKDLWVNLSPYEKDRIVPQSLGLTEMGRDLLAEDYMLKQITASLIYPEDEIGKKFWKRIYEEAEKKFGTTNIPVNTFNKVWIVPEKAVVYENSKAGTAYVVEAKLKVMLEQDYLALSHNVITTEAGIHDTSALGSQIVREIVIPELTKEVNEGKNFAQLRQVYNSLILAAWYKKKIKDSILEQVYADKNKIQGLVIPSKVGIQNKNNVEFIYQRYLQAFKKGVFNYIKEDSDSMTQEIVPRKYFSGGATFDPAALAQALSFTTDAATISQPASDQAEVVGIKLLPDNQTIDVLKILNSTDLKTQRDNYQSGKISLSDIKLDNLKDLVTLLQAIKDEGKLDQFLGNNISGYAARGSVAIYYLIRDVRKHTGFKKSIRAKGFVIEANKLFGLSEKKKGFKFQEGVLNENEYFALQSWIERIVEENKVNEYNGPSGIIKLFKEIDEGKDANLEELKAVPKEYLKQFLSPNNIRAMAGIIGINAWRQFPDVRRKWTGFLKEYKIGRYAIKSNISALLPKVVVNFRNGEPDHAMNSEYKGIGEDVIANNLRGFEEANTGIYHNLNHPLDTSKAVGLSAEYRKVQDDLSSEDIADLKVIGLQHDYERRKKDTMAHVPATAAAWEDDWNRKISLRNIAGESVFQDEYGWKKGDLNGDLRFLKAIAILWRSEFPMYGKIHPNPWYKENKTSPREKYKNALKELAQKDPSGKAVAFAMREGYIFSIIDMLNGYMNKNPQEAIAMVKGFAAEMKNEGFPLTPERVLKGTYAFLSSVGKSFTDDDDLKKELELEGIKIAPFNFPTLQEILNSLPKEYETQLRINMDVFKKMSEAKSDIKIVNDSRSIGEVSEIWQQIQAINKTVTADYYRPSQGTDLLMQYSLRNGDENLKYLLAIDEHKNNKIIGYVFFSTDLRNKFIRISNLAVSPEHQNQRIGIQLLKNVFEFSYGANLSVVGTSSNQNPALVLWDKLPKYIPGLAIVSKTDFNEETDYHFIYTPPGEKMNDFAMSTEGIEELIEWAKAHEGQETADTQQQVADKYDTSRITVSKIFKKYDINSKGKTALKKTKEFRESLKGQQGKTIKSSHQNMSIESGVPVTKIGGILKENGIKSRKRGREEVENTKKLREWANDFKGQKINETQKTIAEKYNLAQSIVNRIFEEYNIKSKGGGKEESENTKKLREWLKSEKGKKIEKSQKDIAEEFNVKAPTVSILLREYGMVRKVEPKKIANLPKWAKIHKGKSVNKTLQEIAGELGVPTTKVNRVLKKYNIRTRIGMDHAMGAKGGIDFNSAKMDLQIQNAGEGIKFHIDPAMLQQLQNAPGFVPVIISIQPLIDLKAFLGIRK